MVVGMLAGAGMALARKVGQKLVGSGLKRLGRKIVGGGVRKLGQKVKTLVVEKAKEKAQDVVKQKLADALGVKRAEGEKMTRKAIEKIRKDEPSTKGMASVTHLGEEDYTAKRGLIHDRGGHLVRQLPRDYTRQSSNVNHALRVHKTAGKDKRRKRRVRRARGGGVVMTDAKGRRRRVVEKDGRMVFV
jgi:hypothetical protein